MFAVIETGGKQYRISKGDRLKVEKLEAAPDGNISFDKVLLVADGEKTEIGAPYVAGAVVSGKVIGEGRARKKIVFKYHSKTRYRKKKGHRQHYTELEIADIKY